MERSESQVLMIVSISSSSRSASRLLIVGRCSARACKDATPTDALDHVKRLRDLDGPMGLT